jgi:ribosomal protein L37AE/L43A
MSKKTGKVNYAKMFQEIKEYIPLRNKKKMKMKQEKQYVCPRCSSMDTKINAGGQFICNGCFLVMKVK